MEDRGRIVIVGAGNVGTTLASTIVTQGLCRQLILIDINRDKVQGEALDLQHAAMFADRRTDVRIGDYSDCAGADIVIITACAPMDPNADNRLDMLRSSQRIMRSVISGVMAGGFDGILIIVSNPVDIMTYYAWKLSGLPASRVIGSGTVLDTARLKCILSGMFEVNPKSIDINVIGEHGDSEVIVWSTAAIGGKSLDKVMKDNENRAEGRTYEQMKQDTVDAGWKIFRRKGNTSYGIAASVSSIVRAIMQDDESIQPVSVCFDGLYGMRDVYMSMPAVIDRSGVREVVELNLSDKEREELEASCRILHEHIALLEGV